MRGRICEECLFEDVCAPAEKLLFCNLLGLDEMDIEYSSYDGEWIEFDETMLTWSYDEYADGDWHWDNPVKDKTIWL